ncbi:MAG: DUF5916 domain-containing protein, partial [Gammaproteobacteria bacterium]|nr:DUF5916 domain-containing protein [Gammaproteobacteria bacterium]
QGGARQEDLGGWNYNAGVGVSFKPIDRFSLDIDLNYRHREAWLLYQGDRDFSTFAADDIQPRLAMDVFINAHQQLRLTMQWAGIVAKERDFYQVPLDDGYLMPVVKDPGALSGDFTISRLTTQLRYRWMIAPLSDLFIVYTRGSNLDNQIDDEFGDLFTNALRTPVVDLLVIKLRYRFGI